MTSYTHRMGTLTIFGLASVSLMLVADALEDRSPVFVLLFAAACAASSVYGFLAGTWPFGLVEAVWTAVAVRRWRTRIGNHTQTAARSFACDMTALSPIERRRYDMLRPLLLRSIEEVRGTATGFRLRLAAATSAPDIAEWMTLERRCCLFLTLRLALRYDGFTWIEIGGSAAIKGFLEDEFQAFPRP